MTTFLLIRHGAHDLLGRILVGRGPGVVLNDEGRRQVAQLASGLQHVPVDCLYTSPMQRCRETAELLAAELRCPWQVELDIQEIDFGDWTMASFNSLQLEARWHLWNARRGETKPPQGEGMIDAQARFSSRLEKWAAGHPDQIVGVVSHGDPIKSVIAYCRKEPLDTILSFDIRPASITVLDWDNPGHRLRLIDGTGPEAATLLRPAVFS